MWMVMAAGSAFFAGVTSILAKIGIRDVDSNLATALRTSVVVVFSWLMVLVSGAMGDISRLTGSTLVFLVLSGLATGASWLCYFRALQLGDVNQVVPVDKSSIILTVVLAFIVFGETVSALKCAALVLIGVGTLLMIERRSAQPGRHRGRKWLLYAVLSAVFASLTSILGKIGVSGINSNLGTAIRTVVVLVFAWGIVLAQGKQRQIASIDRRSWLFLVLSGVATGLSWLCYYNALANGPASVVVPIDKLSVLITVAFASLFMHEHLSKKSALGLALLTAGTLMMAL